MRIETLSKSRNKTARIETPSKGEEQDGTDRDAIEVEEESTVCAVSETKDGGEGFMVRIRTETNEDIDAVRQIHLAAFGGREDESRLADRIRESAGFVPELSLVAEADVRVVGHMLISKAELVDGQDATDTLVLAPIGVLPDAQGRGVGGALIREGIHRAEEMGYKLIFLIGHPSYYPRFGFKPAVDSGLVLMQFDVPDDVFMVRELAEGELARLAATRKEKYGGVEVSPDVFRLACA
ncbi:GNAT family N-acetyltransferase [Cohnella rhizosphaerae]|uniref:N-acetyltransferase n=1 Tax=Cohnella rhizosphaerae TaxID=1457232 RepID=A0A9X4KU28_9BACL|nr:N-acetyltransferase [Cohnella rhizosphaerae]MDG0811069.1 N-acetyltransferase [Cohnella rhizosphaerae]